MTEQVQSSSHEVALTEKAATVIREAFAAESVDPNAAFVRVGARMGGCSGYKFEMGFEDGSRKPSDEIFTSRGIQLIVDRTTLNEVLGSVEIDYQDENLVEQGFKFRQIIAGNVCGCGESFQAIKDIQQN